MFLNDCSFVISYTSRIPAGVATDRLDGTDKDLDGVGRAAMDRDILIRLSESTHSVAVVCGRDGLEALLSCSIEKLQLDFFLVKLDCPQLEVDTNGWSAVHVCRVRY